ncbi:MAG: hypothetical protein QOE09_375 [Ilumatobacteraceae bacterium]|jgi:hypothetical protein
MSKPAVLAVTITGDAKGLKGATDEAEHNLKGFSGKMSGFMAGIGSAVGTMAVNAGSALMANVGDWIALGKSADIFDKKANTVFENSSGDVKKWADSVNESFGLSDEAVVGMAANLGDLIKPMGFSAGATADLTKEMLNSAGALSAWSGGKFDAAEVSDIMAKALLGETDGLKALGISISAAEVEQRALMMTGKASASELTQQDKALATQALMLEKSTDAQKAWTDGTMDGVKKSNEMNASFEDAKQAIGSALLPMIQKLTAWFVNSALPAIRNVIAVFKKEWPQIKEAVMNVVEPIIRWFQTNWPIIQATVKEAFDNIRTIIETITGIIMVLWDHFGSYIMTFIESTWKFVKSIVEAGIKFVKGIIDVFMGIITGDWGRAWDGIKSMVSAVWDAIKAVIKRVLDEIKLAIQIVWDGIKFAASGAWDAVKHVVGSAIDAVVGFVTGIPGRIGGVISTMWDGIKSGMSSAKDWVRDRINDVVGLAVGLPGRVGGVFSGMWDGIKNAFKAALNWIIGKWNGLEFKLPGISAFGYHIGGQTIGVPDIPMFHSGGLVPGFPGQESLALLTAGERVISRGQNTGGTFGTSNVTINLPVGTDPLQAAEVARKYQRRTGRTLGALT